MSILRGRRYEPYTAEERAEMVRLYRDELWSLPEVARQFGCDHTTVRLWLIRAGVPRRNAQQHAEAQQERFQRALRAKDAG